MGWNYRIVKIEPQSVDNSPIPPYYGVITAWYSKSGELNSCSEPPAAPYGSSLSELKGDIAYFIRSLEKEVLSNSDFDVEFGPPYKEIPTLVIHRTTYPQPDRKPNEDPPEEDFCFMVIREDGNQEPFVPTASSIDLLRAIFDTMITVIENQQAPST